MAQDPLHLLCIEPRFPGRLAGVADWLVRRRGFRCQFYCNAASPREPWPESAGRGLDVIAFGVGGVAREGSVGWRRTLERGLCHAYGCWEVLDARHPRPVDVILGRSDGLGSSLFAPSFAPRTPVVQLFDYVYHPREHDLAPEAGPEMPASYFHWRRSANAMDLLDLENGVTPWTATLRQRDLYPAEDRDDFQGLHDGGETRGPLPDRPRSIAGRSIPAGTKVVGFASRETDRVRGFDLFMEVARRIAGERPDVLFIVVGNEGIYYDWDVLRIGGPSFKRWVLDRGGFDLENLVFLGHVESARLAEVLRISDLHVYLSAPFVLSWSLLDAMATGLVVLASDVAPVRVVIEPGVNGLVAPLFDADALADSALRVLADPAGFAPLGRAARETIEAWYSLDVTIPALEDYFERVASAGGRP